MEGTLNDKSTYIDMYSFELLILLRITRSSNDKSTNIDVYCIDVEYCCV